MPYPPEIALVACTVGGASALESGTQLVLSAEITSSRGLMWGATGWQFPSITRTVTGTEGAELSFSLPATSLAGWRLLDDSGSTIDVSTPGSYTHTYTIRLTTLLSGRPVGQRTIGPFVLPAGSGPVDLDTMLPAPTVSGGVVLVPDTWGPMVAAAEAAAADAVAALDAASWLAPGQALATALDMGVGDVELTVLGDSTGNDWFEWPQQLGEAIAAQYPDLAVLVSHWNHDTQAYNAATVLQSGTSTEPVTLMADDFNRTASELVGSTPTTGAAWQGTTGRFSIDGSKAVVNAAGLAHAYPSTATADEPVTVTASVGMNCAGGAATVRTLEIGAKVVDTNNHLFLSLSVPTGSGLTWSVWQRIGGTATKLGDGPSFVYNTTRTVAASITVDGSTVSATVDGSTVSFAIAGATVTALSAGRGVTLWAKNADVVGTTIDSVTVTGTRSVALQTLHVWNGSRAGSTLTYQLDRLALMLPATADVAVISSCHNYGTDSPATYLAAVHAAVDAIRARAAGVEVIVSGQNPEFPDGGRSQAMVDAHAARLAALRLEALRRGWGYWPVYEKWRTLVDGGRAWVQADGIHPTYDAGGTYDGSQVWVGVAQAYLDGLALV